MPVAQKTFTASSLVRWCLIAEQEPEYATAERIAGALCRAFGVPREWLTEVQVSGVVNGRRTSSKWKGYRMALHHAINGPFESGLSGTAPEIDGLARQAYAPVRAAARRAAAEMDGVLLATYFGVPLGRVVTEEEFIAAGGLSWEEVGQEAVDAF